MTIPSPASYLQPIGALCRIDYPDNRLVNIVCHGHSVPSGYYQTPEIRSLESYPHLLRLGLAARYPHAVINVIVTAIDGENSVRGAARFERDVLCMQPDVITIDYSLNDRGLGLAAPRKAWCDMIEQAFAKNLKVILLTPTPDQAAKFADPADPLNQQAEQVRELATHYGVGLIDSLALFKARMRAGVALSTLMSSGNHPNLAGHQMVADALLDWFP